MSDNDGIRPEWANKDYYAELGVRVTTARSGPAAQGRSGVRACDVGGVAVSAAARCPYTRLSYAQTSCPRSRKCRAA